MRFPSLLITLCLLPLASRAGLLESERTAPAVPALGAHELRLLTPSVLELGCVTTKAADQPVGDWNFVGPNFAPALPPAGAFLVSVDGLPATVTAVGFKRRPLYAPLRQRDLRIGNWLYLKLAAPVGEGQTVRVTNPSGNVWNDGSRNLTARLDAARFNPALHVNQLGYAPGGSKLAMVGYYLGSLGELPVSATTFEIVDANSAAVVYSGPLRQRRDVGYNYTDLPYQLVFEADFSALTAPGEYRLRMPGMGVSYAFWINEGIDAAYARTYALGLYHQRCGTDNQFPHTRHDHAVCHAAPAGIPTMANAAVNRVLADVSWDFSQNPLHTAPQLKDVSSSLYPFVNTAPVDVSGGHHDAGDYSKYTIDSAGLVHHLVFAADAFPGAALLDNLGLPESGDGKSDLLQEAKWEADFLAKMQDADGGFYFLVYPRDRRYEDDVLPAPGDPQVVFPKNTAVTAAAVAALAEIASSPAFRNKFPADANLYLTKAKLGWDFLTRAIAAHGKNGAYQKLTHYGNEFMHDDELAWAAAALFAATGEPAYHAKLKEWYQPADRNTRRWTWWRLFEGYGCAARTYAFAARSGRLPQSALDPAYLAQCEAELVAAGDDIARFAEQTAYGTSFPDPNKSFRSAGWYFSSERAFELATAFQLNATPRYLAAIRSNLAYESGCNPVNIPFVTGIGWPRWHDIVNQYALNDRRALPPSGILLGNIQGGFAYLENYKQELGALCFPPDGASSNPYPFYDRWGDSFNTTTEFVVVDQARALATAAMLLARTGDFSSPSQNVGGTILGLPASIPALETVTVTLAAPGFDLSQARVTWEAADQSPQTTPVFSFQPREPGAQWIEAEALLPNGRRVFARASFNATFPVSLPPNRYQSQPAAPAADIVKILRLDAPGEGLALSGQAAFDSSNLGWMSARSGAALRFTDLGDQAVISIPAPALYSAGTTREITLEALIYIHSYRGWNRGAAKILSLERTWNASLQFKEDTYTGPHLGGGTQFDFFGPALAAALPLKEWHHLSLSISQTGYSARVDGVQIAAAPGGELAGWGGGPAILEFGNFDGWIDEVIVRSRGIAEKPPAPARAEPLATDRTLGGSWKGRIGRDGYLIAGDSEKIPAWAELSVSGAAPWMWNDRSYDPRALQRAGDDSRLLACRYSAGEFSVSLRVLDGAPHLVSFYCHDPAASGRIQRVDVYSAATGAKLQSVSLANFTQGAYLPFVVEGSVVFRFVNMGPWNAVMSGVFFDPVAPPDSVTYSGFDTQTSGSWKGVYGSLSSVLAGEPESFAAGPVAAYNALRWIWCDPTPDPRALLHSGNGSHFAACLYSPGDFTVSVALPPGESRQISFYCLDASNSGRRQRVEVLGGPFGPVLHALDVSSMSNGVYLKYRASGTPLFRFVNTGPWNAVLSGVFIDP